MGMMMMMMMRIATGTMLCVTLLLSLLLTIIDAASIPAGHDQLQVIYHGLANDYQQLDHRTVLLPRKLLKVNNYVVEGSESKSLVPSNKQNKDSLVELQKKGKGGVEVVTVHAAKGTRQEWIETSDQSSTSLDFFTMDYSQVRRRRPIHNKSFPNTAMNNSP